MTLRMEITISTVSWSMNQQFLDVSTLEDRQTTMSPSQLPQSARG
ncbi:hypothetical protein MUK42_02758 [Musa troglodytarum]|nr:hypothetical protein MUK42_02758 [Musa troglodytarum]